jgi:hypothetical protein
MSPLATVETNKSVKDFINSIENESKREDSKKLLKMFQKITGKKPKIWGDNFIIGFGKYKYKRKGSKEELEWFNVGFAPRKTNITLYVTYDISEETALVKELGKCKWGKGCLYIKRLDDVDLDVLSKVIAKSKDSSWF